MLQFEQPLWDRGHVRVAGIDEAGRGPLAGPVVAAAVVFLRTFAESQQNELLAGLTDSKQLSEGRREQFYALLIESDQVEIGVGRAGHDEIDRLNILHATHLAMGRAVAALPEPPGYALVDGLGVTGLPCPSMAIVKGDARSLSIAAASIVAKVVRDRRMRELDARFPQYGFARHKGYGSPKHIQALFEYGPCEEHRRSFSPVRQAIEIRERRQRELFEK